MLKLGFRRSCRCLSTGTAQKSKNLATALELRRLTNAPIIKIRKALTECGGDFQAAVTWLERDLVEGGMRISEKLKSRKTAEGLVGVFHGSNHNGAMIELNCETDFVARTNEFGTVVQDIAFTVANSNRASESTSRIFQTVNLEKLAHSPLLSPNSSRNCTVQAAIMELMSRTGENIVLRRATLLNQTHQGTEQLRLGSYIHNPVTLPTQGRMAALVAVRLDSPKLPKLLQNQQFTSAISETEVALARQIVGFRPESVDVNVGDPETVLYKQPFAMLGGDASHLSVSAFMDQLKAQWQLDQCEVVDFARWEVGDLGFEGPKNQMPAIERANSKVLTR